MLLKIPQEEIGPPVDWSSCLHCGEGMRAEDERYRIAIGDRVGIGHKGCQDEVIVSAVEVKIRAAHGASKSQ